MENKFGMNKIEKAEDFDFSYLASKYLRSWPLFLFLVIASISGAFLYLSYKVPVYEVSATLLIKDDKKGLNESDMLQSLDLFSSKKIVENEIVILNSRDLLNTVVNNLKLYAPVFEQGKIKSKPAYSKSPLLVEVKQPEFIVPQEKIYFKYNSSYNDVIVRNKTYPINSWVRFGKDSLRFIKNPMYKKDIGAKPVYFSLITPDEAVAKLSENLNISAANKQSSVINLKIKDEVPKRGVDILTELIRCYNSAAIQDKNELAQNTLSFVEDRLHYLVIELDSVETALQKYKSHNNITDISEQGKIYLSNVGANDMKVSEVNMQLAVMEEVEKYVVSKKAEMGIVPSTLGVNDAVLSQLLQKMYDLEMQEEKLKKSTGENNPMVVSIKDQIEKIRPNILENIRNQRSNLLAGKSKLNNNNNMFAGMLQTIPQKEKELLEISRQQAIKNNIYTFLLQKREETALSFASAVADSRIVEKAASGLQPISPGRNIVYAAAILAALVLGLIIISLKELFSKNVDLRSEIEKYIAWPILGEISNDRTKKSIIISENEQSFIAEQFRQIRTSLSYVGINEDHKKILITSSVSQEGKSFVAGNLAISLALTGKKVVLIELDLRKPKLSPVFHANSEIGMSNFLKGTADVSMIVQSTDINENLSFISSGPVPSNPAELLLSEKVPQLFKNLEVYYDYIIIDTAPIGPVADAEIISKHADATLYVVRQGCTPKAYLKKLKNNNKLKPFKNGAVIYNGIKDESLSSYGYGYSYSNNDNSLSSFDQMMKKLRLS